MPWLVYYHRPLYRERATDISLGPQLTSGGGVGSLKAGYFRACITPPVGTPMSGYALREGPSIGVHDDLYVRAVYLECGSEAFAIAAADLLGVDRDLFESVARAVEREVGLEPDRLTVLGTHTHSGPALQAHWSGEGVRALREVVARAIAGAVAAAARELADVRVASGVSEVRGVSVNRRDPRAGPIDPRVHVVALCGAGGIDVIISSFSCHAVVLGHNNRLISADYPGALNRTVEEVTGAKSAFLNGTCGDINPLTPGTSLERVYDRSVGTFEDVEWMGRILGCEASKVALLSKPRARDADLRCSSARVELRAQRPCSVSEARRMVEEAEARLAKAEGAPRQERLRAMLELYRARAVLHYAERYGERGAVEVDLRALALGDEVALVFLPSEVLVELGASVKEASPFPNTIVASYANHYFGYIAPAHEYPKGGYEVTYPTTVLEPGEGERLAEAAIELLGKLTG